MDNGFKLQITDYKLQMGDGGAGMDLCSGIRSRQHKCVRTGVTPSPRSDAEWGGAQKCAVLNEEEYQYPNTKTCGLVAPALI